MPQCAVKGDVCDAVVPLGVKGKGRRSSKRLHAEREEVKVGVGVDGVGARAQAIGLQVRIQALGMPSRSISGSHASPSWSPSISVC